MKTTIFTLALLLACNLGLPIHAQEVLEAAVAVDVTGNDATDARNKALDQAQGEALAQLIDKQAPGQGKSKVASLTNTQIGNLVRGFEVLEEKISSKRYRATIRYRFDGEKIQALLGGVASAPVRAGSVLVLPVQYTDSTPTLWEGENSWKSIFSGAAVQAGQGNIIVPPGDNTDTATVNAEEAVNADFTKLQSLAGRYGTSRVAVVIAGYNSTDIPLVVRVIVKELGPGVARPVTRTYTAAENETPEIVMARAAMDVVGQLMGAKEKATAPAAEKTMAPVATEQKLTLLAPLSDIADWTNLKIRLSALPMVSKVTPAALSYSQADMVLTYTGSADALQAAMEEAGLRVKKSSTYWMIER